MCTDPPACSPPDGFHLGPTSHPTAACKWAQSYQPRGTRPSHPSHSVHHPLSSAFALHGTPEIVLWGRELLPGPSGHLSGPFWFFKQQDLWIEADVASNQILKGKCRVDGASLARMSWDTGLHSGAVPQISVTEQTQKAAHFISSLWECYIAVAPHLQHSVPPKGADNPTKGLVPESGHWKVLLDLLESSYWAPGFRSNVPLKGPGAAPAPCSICLIPDPEGSSPSCSN
jgi:hypothetical protein